MKADRFAINALTAKLGGGLHWPSSTPEDTSFSHLATDSRKLKAASNGAKHTLFIALKGVRHDGHDFLNYVHAQGVRGFIVDDGWEGSLTDSVVIKVPNTLVALQELGAIARFSRKGTMVGITGSNGKTIVKEWALALAGQDRRLSRSPGSWNSQVGVPLSLWSLDD